MAFRSLDPTVSWMWLLPGQIMTHDATRNSVLTILVNLMLSLLVSFSFSSLITIDLTTRQSYLWRALSNVSFDWQREDTATRDCLTDTICRTTVRFTTIAVDAGHGSLTTILVACIILTTNSVDVFNYQGFPSKNSFNDDFGRPVISDVNHYRLCVSRFSSFFSIFFCFCFDYVYHL